MLIALALLLMTAGGAQAMELSISAAAQSVVLLHTPTSKGIVVGTGFVVDLQGTPYLVTAEHVANDLGATPNLTYGGSGDAATTEPLLSIAGSSKLDWVRHPTADVAVLRLKGSQAVVSTLLARALKPLHLIGNLEAPPRDRPLTVLGFPLGLGGLALGPDQKISPISKETHAASGLITLARADTKKPAVFFILQDPSVGGFSGAPVFMLPSAFSSGGGLAFTDDSGFCVGLSHGTLSDSTGGKLGAVVPVAHIAETLQLAFERK